MLFRSRYLVCMEVFQEFPITLFEINDTKMWLSGTKRKIKTDFGEKEISVKNTFQTIFALFSICFFCILGCILIFVKDVEASSTAK